MSKPVDDADSFSNPVRAPVEMIDGEGYLDFTLAEDSDMVGLLQLDSDQPELPIVFLSSPQYGLLEHSPAGESFRYIPYENYHGPDDFSFQTDSGRVGNVRLQITAVPDAPVLSINLPETADLGRSFAGVLEASDADGDELIFSAFELPDWLTLDAQSGVLSGVPGSSDLGLESDMRFVVTDATGLTDELTGVSIEVVDVNGPPIFNLTQAPDKLLARQSISFSTFAEDPDGDEYTVTVEASPFIAASVSGDNITLTAADVESVTNVNLAIVGRDEFGAVTRELIEVPVYPRTESGNGITVRGYREGAGLHVVVLGDGYTSDQQLRFEEHVDEIIDQLARDSGISAHLGALNIHRIATVSNDSGADDRFGDDDRDTAFNSGYNCRSIQRLICADTAELLTVAFTEFPAVQQIILLVNDIRYGGSGNSGSRVATTSAFYPEIAIHEMGHSLADLADEYVDNNISQAQDAPSFEQGQFANVSLTDNPALVPWAHWLPAESALEQPQTDQKVGVFEGGFYRATGVFRPTENSRMREFDQPFGPVNSEQWVLRLYTETSGIRRIEPQSSVLRIDVGQSRRFSVEPIFGLENQTVEWALNGQRVNPGDDSTNLELSFVRPGSYELVMTVTDITGVIKLSGGGIFTNTWDLQVE
ncbi:MAG: M64 family metallopeptidase [Granulosicoccus sp.]